MSYSPGRSEDGGFTTYGRGSEYNKGLYEPNIFEDSTSSNLEVQKQDKNLSLLDATNNRVDTLVQSASDVGNKNQNQGVVTPLNTSQTANANIENTTSDVNFVRFNKNQFIASQHRNLPPEVLRRLT